MGFIEQKMHLAARLRVRLFTLLLAGQFKEFGRGCRVVPPFRFHGLYEMQLGEKVLIERDCWIQTYGPPREGGVAKLIIGAHAGIGMGATISAAQQVTIGEHVLLARNVYISDHAHAFEDLKVPIMNQGVKKIMPVSVGRNSWLGQNVVVLPGAAIGEHCVIGANSIVNSAIPDYSVAVGSPAVVVKQYSQKTGEWERFR